MNTIPIVTVSNFQQALLAGNKAQCSHIVKSLINKDVPLVNIYEHLLKKSLYLIGDLWEQNKISVANEHLASSIVENILSELYIHLHPNIPVEKKVIVCSVPGEQHQIGLKMVNDVFELYGWETYYLGANVPVKDLVHFAKGISPDLMAFSLSLYFNYPALVKLIGEISIHFPDTPILVGGQAFNKGDISIIKKYNQLEY